MRPSRTLGALATVEVPAAWQRDEAAPAWWFEPASTRAGQLHRVREQTRAQAPSQAGLVLAEVAEPGAELVQAAQLERPPWLAP